MTEKSRFWNGQELQGIFWSEGSGLNVGQRHCKRITVVMENGEMSPVAWFHIEYDNDRGDQKYNGKFVEGVTL